MTDHDMIQWECDCDHEFSSEIVTCDGCGTVGCDQCIPRVRLAAACNACGPECEVAVLEDELRDGGPQTWVDQASARIDALNQSRLADDVSAILVRLGILHRLASVPGHPFRTTVCAETLSDTISVIRRLAGRK